MTAAVSKPRKKKFRELKSFDTTYLRKVGRRAPHDDNGDIPKGLKAVVEGNESYDSFDNDPFAQALMEELKAAQPPTALEKKVGVFFRRVENVTIHIIDRLSTLALKAVKKYEGR